jgi:Bardet-Biedl syndrome 2 protein
LKASIVRAEASLMINDIEGVRTHYAGVQAMNGALLGEYTKRTNNHEGLIGGLKQLNNFIRCASNLRVGPRQREVVAACREAIKGN